jgi:uncharacterized protein (TIRG00374 family)
MTPDLKKKLIIGFVFGLVVLLGLLVYTDVQELSNHLEHFNWIILVPALSLTLFNYLLRFFKWHFYLHLIGVKNMRWRDSMALFVSGFTLAVSPGKAAEVLKSVVLKGMTGTPLSRSVPVVLAERLTDGFAMLLLASGGVVLYPDYWPAFAAVLGAMVCGVIVIQIRPLSLWLLQLVGRLPFLTRLSKDLLSFYESSYQLLKLKNLALAVLLGVISWAGEGVAFYLILLGLGLQPGTTLLFQAIFILSFATIVGAVSGLPGGLGAAEASVGAMLQALAGLDRGLAGTATLLIRFCTLWFGVGLGLVTLMVFRRLLLGNFQDDLSGDESPEQIEA